MFRNLLVADLSPVFCHNDQEKVPFWNLYGGKIKKNKVLLQFKKFCD